MLEIIKVSKSRPKFPKNGLVLYLDAADQRSYNGSNIWNDLSGLMNHVQLYGSVSKEGNSLISDGVNGYGRTINTLNLKHTKAITTISVLRVPIEAGGVLYEHTPNWNQTNDYNGVNYGGFGLAVNSTGSDYEDSMHFQFKGNDVYSGINITAPTSQQDTMYTVIHDATKQTIPQSSAYINGVLTPHGSGSPYIGLSSDFFGDDYFYLWARGGVSLPSKSYIALLLIYDRVLSQSEVNEIKSMIQDRFDF